MEALEKHLGDLCALVDHLRDQIVLHCDAPTHCRRSFRDSTEDSFTKIMCLTQNMWDDLKNLKESASNDHQTQAPSDPPADTASASEGRKEDAPSRSGGSAEQSSLESTCVDAQATNAVLREAVSRPFIAEQGTAGPPEATSSSEATSNEQSTNERSSDTERTSSCHSAARNMLGEVTGGGCAPNDRQMDCCGEDRGPFVLRPDDMGERLVPAIMALAANPSFHGTLTIDGPKRDVSSLNVDLGEGDYYGVQHAVADRERASNIWLMKHASSFHWPNFDKTPDRPSAEESRDFLEAIVASPPEKPIDYYGGSATSLLDNMLYPGRVLAQSTELQDMKSTYYHIGVRGSATGFHCEDAEFWSCNVTDAGYKIWLIIEPHHTEMFERFIRANWTCGDCDQFVRHLCLLIAPSRLQEEGIDFSVCCAGPNEMVITRPRQYHVVVNYTSCFARSTNFVPDEQALLPTKLVVCEQDGLYPLHQFHPMQVVIAPTTQPAPTPDRESESQKRRRKALPSKVEDVARAKSARALQSGRTASTTAHEIARLAKSLLKQDPELNLPDVRRLSNPTILKLAAALRGSSCTQQVKSLCQERAKDESSAVIRRTGNDNEVWESQITYLRAATAGSAFQKFKIRLIEYAIAEKVSKGKRRCRLRADTSELDAFADKFWPEDTGKQKLRYHLYRGRKWLRLCGSLVGLLAYIPLHRVDSLGIGPKDYWALGESDIERFHDMFTDDFGKSICSTGKTVVEMVLYGS